MTERGLLPQPKWFATEITEVTENEATQLGVLGDLGGQQPVFLSRLHVFLGLEIRERAQFRIQAVALAPPRIRPVNCVSELPGSEQVSGASDWCTMMGGSSVTFDVHLDWVPEIDANQFEMPQHEDETHPSFDSGFDSAGE